MKYHLILAAVLLATAGLLYLQQAPSTPYVLADSIDYATYSSLAFCTKECVEAWNCKSGAKAPKLINVTYIENNATKAVSYIGYDPENKKIIISWRGSCNAKNWMQDFNFEMTPYHSCKGCFIHTGFLTDYLLNEKKLLERAAAIIENYDVNEIVCTGHSLGAALSTISGVSIAQKYPNIPVIVHNFGSPRLGNENLAQFISQKVKQIFRVVHHKDVVPHLPPEVEYKHPAFEVFFDSDMVNYKVCDDSGEDKTCSNQYFPTYDPNDHDFYFVYISHVQC